MKRLIKPKGVIKYVKRNKIKIFLFILFTTILILSIIMASNYYKYNKINSGEDSDRETVNKHALPLIDDNNKYIELQTKRWIGQRKNKEPCYGLLEKDKIIMAKWIKMFDIKGPTIRYFNYHKDFKIEDLYQLVQDFPEKRFVIKISHLQSNYGIIIIPPNSNVDKINRIYSQCLNKFKTCFVCNHDKSDAPTNEEISRGEKKSYYELYQTIEPGIMIQDFFYSHKEGELSEPIEHKILVFGDKIINGAGNDIKRMELVYSEAKRISKLLGSTLIRVDFFVKKSDNPYIPYLNEISLSPANGLNVSKSVKWTGKLDQYKKNVNDYKAIGMPKVDNLIRNAPFRTLPIDRYMTDGEWGVFVNDKFRF